MKPAFKNIFTLLLIAIFITACGSNIATTQSDVDTLLTAAVGTMVYSYFDTQTAIYTAETATPASTPASTPTLLPTFTPLPSVTLPPSSPTYVYFTPTLGTFTPAVPTVTGTLPTATVNPGALGYGCNNLAFIRDVNIPAGSVLQRNEEVTKTWKVQNTGSCIWTFQYRLVFLSGDDLKASGDYIQKQVIVWDWAEVSIQFNAPKKPGTYTSYWRMVDANGNMFGATLILSFVVSE